MDPFIYIIAGVITGIWAGRYTKGEDLFSKRAVIAAVVIVVASLAAIIFVDQLPCFLGEPNCD